MGDMKKGYSFVFMGVASSGKSTIGAMVSQKIGCKFIDGDDLHPRANIKKMRSGQALNDNDRTPWLQRINDAAFSIEQKGETGVIVCSALKRQYRDLIREENKKVKFVYLHGDFDLVLERMQARKGHFMPVELLKSQFETLERPTDDETDVLVVNIDGSMDEVVDRSVSAIASVVEG